MPIFRAKSVDALPEPPELPPRDGRNLKLACELSDICIRLQRKPFPPGVYRNSSIELSLKRRQEWEKVA